MRTLITFAAATLAPLAFATPMAAAFAQTPTTQNAGPDQNGKCAGPDGKDAASVACKGAGPSPGAGGPATYKLDKKGVCRDGKGKLMPADKCKT
ncbi:MAG: hypothetical protein WDN45_04705 [Caulobacteraceae bacterium]